jgi:DNA mismatch endonuclease, patch repair protein
VSAPVHEKPPVERSRLMSKVRGKDTTPEMAVRRAAYALGYRFRLHCPDLPGRPDIVFASRRKAIFVHGCFWHRHSGCHLSSMPKTRVEFWGNKFARNVERDEMTERALIAAGWQVLVIWECETRNAERLTSMLTAFLS